MSKKIIALLLSMLMLVSVFAACSSNSTTNDATETGDVTGNTNTEGTIKIGLSGPLTGGAAVYGVAVKNSAEMAVEEINAAGGVNGYKLELLATDDTHDASKVSTNYYNMYEAGMQVSLGCVTSDPCLEFCALSADDNLFFITPSASNDDVPAEDNAYQMCFADGNQGKVAAEYVNGLGLEKIGVFYKNDDSYSKGIYEQFKANIDSSVEVVETLFTSANETDFTAQISTLKDCEFIFMPIYYTPASQFMLQAKSEMSETTVYYGCDGFDGLASVEGFDITAIPQKITMLSHFNSNAETGAAAEFIAKYTDKYGVDTLNQFGASAYDCVYALAAAMEVAVNNGEDITPDTDPSDLCDILIDVFQGGFEFTGNVTGEEGSTITWDENGYVMKAAIAYPMN
ncbi:MAG: ABC transporter substrate-binding protein [Clostridia bacterium]|nr:ABC transporter substrate-binding protein [Clostridia bacterium]